MHMGNMLLREDDTKTHRQPYARAVNEICVCVFVCSPSLVFFHVDFDEQLLMTYVSHLYEFVFIRL